MPSYPYPKTPNGIAGRRAFSVFIGGTIMKRIFPFLFTFLLLCLTGCTAAAEIGYTQIDQETAKEIRDLDLLTVGLVNDMYIESDNDSENYAQVATQKDDLF